MTSGDFTSGAVAHRRAAAFQRAGHQAVKPVRDLRALTGDAVPYDIGQRRVLIDPKTLTYWIPFVAGLGLMIGGMKTAGSPFLGVPQLILGIALIGIAAWDYVSDTGVLQLTPAAAPAPATGYAPLSAPPPPALVDDVRASPAPLVVPAPPMDDVRPAPTPLAAPPPLPPAATPLAAPPPLPPQTRLEAPPPPAPPPPSTVDGAATTDELVLPPSPPAERAASEPVAPAPPPLPAEAAREPVAGQLDQ